MEGKFFESHNPQEEAERLLRQVEEKAAKIRLVDDMESQAAANDNLHRAFNEAVANEGQRGEEIKGAALEVFTALHEKFSQIHEPGELVNDQGMREYLLYSINDEYCVLSDSMTGYTHQIFNDGEIDTADDSSPEEFAPLPSPDYLRKMAATIRECTFRKFAEESEEGHHI